MSWLVNRWVIKQRQLQAAHAINLYSEISFSQTSVMGLELVIRSEISVIWGFYAHSGCLGMKILPLSPQNAQFWWVYNQLLAGKQHRFFCSIVIFCRYYWAIFSNRIAPIAEKIQVLVNLRCSDPGFQGYYPSLNSLWEISFWKFVLIMEGLF